MQTTRLKNGQTNEIVSRLERLQALTASLLEAATSERVADALLSHSLAELGAVAGAVYRLSEDGREFVALRMTGYPDDVVADWSKFPADARVPIADAVRQGQPVVVPTLAEMRQRYPLAARFPILQGEAVALAIPLTVRGRAVGGIGLRFPGERAELGVRSIVHKKFRVTTTDSDHDHPVFENRLDRDFAADAPNRKWAADITYIPTGEGFAYLAGVVDLFSRRIVGWSLKDTLHADLCVEALEMALAARRPGRPLLHHSDRGCQYAARQYQDALTLFMLECSMSRVV